MKWLFIIFASLFAEALKPNLCIECAFYKKDPLSHKKFGKCLLFPEEISNDYFFVDGTIDKNINYHYCSTARNMHHMCGEEGKFYNKKGFIIKLIEVEENEIINETNEIIINEEESELFID